MHKSKPPADSPYAKDGARLVDMGYSAIPVMPGSKRPGSMSHGEWYGDMNWSRYCDRLPTEIETSIWSRWPDAGVCVAVDHNIKVIDVDTDDLEIRAAIEAVIPPSPVKKRGAKGYSAFYRGSAEIVSRPFSIVLPGGYESRIIDLLAHGRQTVLPPTIHPDVQRPYEWLTEDKLLDTSPDQLPVLPDNIADLLESALEPFGEVKEFKPRLTRGEDVFGETIWREVNDAALSNMDAWVPALFGKDAKRRPDGSYRARAFWRGVENNNVGIHADGIRDWGGGDGHTPINLVMAANSTTYFEVAYDWLRKQIGYEPSPDEWSAVAERMAQRMSQKYHERASLVVIEPTVPAAREEVTAVPVRAPRANMNPFDPSSAGGIIEAIANWSLGSSRRPVPEFAILSATAFVATMFSRQAVGPTGAGLNVYLVGVAGPGFGKEHTHKTLHTLATDTGLGYLIGPGEVTSGSAIEKVARKRPMFVMPWDEMGVVLQSVTGFGSSAWAKTIRKVLLEVFSKSSSMWSGKEHADPTKDNSSDPIHCPTISLLGLSTPTTFYKGLSEESLSDGFVARLVVIEAKKRPERQAAPALMTTPPSLVAAVKESLGGIPIEGNLKGNWRTPTMRPVLYTVPWDGADAEHRWQAIEDWQYGQIEDHGAHDGLIGRTAEHVIKLATIRALSRNSTDPKVTVEDVDWGYAFVQRSIDCIETGAREYMAGSQFEELCLAIKRALAKSGGEMPQSVLVRAKGVSKADDKMVKAALERLEVAGEIYKPSIEGRGMKVKLRRPEQEAA